VEEVHPEGQLKTPTHGDPILPMSKQLESTRYFVIVGLAYQGKNIVFRFIIEYNSLRDFGP